MLWIAVCVWHNVWRVGGAAGVPSSPPVDLYSGSGAEAAKQEYCSSPFFFPQHSNCCPLAFFSSLQNLSTIFFHWNRSKEILTTYKQQKSSLIRKGNASFFLFSLKEWLDLLLSSDVFVCWLRKLVLLTIWKCFHEFRNCELNCEPILFTFFSAQRWSLFFSLQHCLYSLSRTLMAFDWRTSQP